MSADPAVGICAAVERARWTVWEETVTMAPRSYARAVQEALHFRDKYGVRLRFVCAGPCRHCGATDYDVASGYALDLCKPCYAATTPAAAEDSDQ